MRKGLTIIEVLIAAMVLSVATIGTTQFRYQAALDARRADVQILAGRTAVLLMDSWRGNLGSAAFNPVASLGTLTTIAVDASGPALPSGNTLLNKYKVTANGVTFYVTLSWQDVAAKFRCLNVNLAYDDRGQGTGYGQMNKNIRLTTYVNY